jgi:CubicO group peptidase (beta-lactamase class C family)
VLDDASPLRENAVFKVASCTKLITSIAVLQCVEQGLIDLDQPLTKILPELECKEILADESAGQFIFESSKTKITARHLLTHTSGLAYRVMTPLLIKWAETPEGLRIRDSDRIPERYDLPLVFEPGTGWMYGSGLDWAGVVVRRLHSGISLEKYFVDNIWKRIGLSAPFPTFTISKYPEYKARLMQAAERTSDGGLRPFDLAFGDNPEDQGGGDGLVLSVKDYTAVLTDLISDSPKLLKAETIAMIFTPQIATNSNGISMLKELRPVWDFIAGPASEDAVNHGLAGLLTLSPIPEIGQPANVLAWGGASCPAWFASRDLGVAGFFATQLSPYGDPTVRTLINAWKKDFWAILEDTGS